MAGIASREKMPEVCGARDGAVLKEIVNDARPVT
ncbi:hypothetical protein M2262_003685 [Pseudomonas sp. BIGb0408]|uniref:Uncharacterized protein n=1 Tax=Phytopseudomonas flavescens TaxID=29435 RepID=A0A7Z0BMG2_9GAMM|nr:hypothetical protein [Pseudomonas sp. BIGb0408]NYH71795.1 hypothetical protein [Pseudomonas flavescens]